LPQAFREAGILLVVAAALSCVYTAATEKGFFVSSAPAKAALGSERTTPSMITREEAWSLYQAGSALFVDARLDFDYQAGHIKGAISVPLKEYNVKRNALDAIQLDRLIIAYCDGAECNSSIELAVKLRDEGFKNVRIFFGGWHEWVTAKLPTEK
jgi:rhodanese-related sulfurtransferase